APCLLDYVSPGVKLVRVIAPNYSAELMTTTVESGRERAMLVPLRRSATLVDPKRTELRVESLQPGVTLFVDGQSRGALPSVLTDLPPGAHQLRFDAGPLF